MQPPSSVETSTSRTWQPLPSAKWNTAQAQVQCIDRLTGSARGSTVRLSEVNIMKRVALLLSLASAGCASSHRCKALFVRASAE
ncbi:hypothetical protein EJ065_2995 [Corallococcus coralloides]|uniref:Uncharacterized protein n=1 Tax=Corallococcus coralloides TaxID=184914 RepID=A0A410RRN2_CORCK|nr:hypothetical protein EJ065_2995 [Corallococcus coralloides]